VLTNMFRSRGRALMVRVLPVFDPNFGDRGNVVWQMASDIPGTEHISTDVWHTRQR